MGSSSYGLMAKFALHAKWLESSNKSELYFLCANPLDISLNDLFNRNSVSLKSKNKSSLTV